MENNQGSLISYPEILDRLQNQPHDNNLFLGNGFNLSLGINTDYKSIVQKMKDNGKEYNSVLNDDVNIEHFIGECIQQINESKYSNFIKTYLYNKIKLDFMKAVTQIVSSEIKKIKSEKNEGIYLFLKNFDNYFTLNYDPFLYQLLMTYKKDKKDHVLIFSHTLPEIRNMMDDESKELLEELKIGYESGILTINIDKNPERFDLNKLSKAVFKINMREYFKNKYSKSKIDKLVDHFWNEKESDKRNHINHVDDGFRLFDGKLSFQDRNIQNIFFLHGAFHIISRGQSIYKITQESEKALYNRIEEIIENGSENIVCVFRDKNKLEEIQNNEYLLSAYSKLHKMHGSLIIIGCSLDENDAHIFKEICRSKIKSIYYASTLDSSKEDYVKLQKWFPDKDLFLFDRDTVSYR